MTRAKGYTRWRLKPIQGLERIQLRDGTVWERETRRQEVTGDVTFGEWVAVGRGGLVSHLT